MAFADKPLQSARRLTDEVHLRLRDAILDGELPPGTRLGVAGLAAEFAVSRSPVREAVQALVAEGLAEEEPHRGAVVAEVTLADLVAMYEVREVLEGLAARLAATRADENVLARLQAAVNDHSNHVDDSDPGSHMEADARFHRITHEASGNVLLIEQMAQVQAMVRLAMLTTSVTAGKDVALKEHETLLDAIQRGDADDAERLARGHVARLREALMAQIDRGQNRGEA